MSQLSPEEELSLHSVTRFPDAQKLQLGRKPLPGQEQPWVPCAAKAVWHDGAEPCPAQTLPANGGRAGPVPPCTFPYLPAPPCISLYLPIPARTSPLGFCSPQPEQLLELSWESNPNLLHHVPHFPNLYCSSISCIFNRNLLKLWYSQGYRRLL